jgi:TctA family transporter
MKLKIEKKRKTFIIPCSYKLGYLLLIFAIILILFFDIIIDIIFDIIFDIIISIIYNIFFIILYNDKKKKDNSNKS